MDELRASYSALKGPPRCRREGGGEGWPAPVAAPALAGYLASAAGHVGAVALARHMAGGGHEKTSG